MLGNQQEPGITSSVESAPTLASGSPSPGTAMLVGGAELSGNDANANEVHAIATANRARQLFGSVENSRLTKEVVDALGQGANPVLAVAPSVSTTSKDLSSLGSQEGSLANPPREDIDSITVDVDGDTKTVSLVYDEVSGMSPSSGEVYLNPVTQNFKLDSAPSSSGSFEYDALDYTSALDVVRGYEGNVDFLAALKETASVTTEVHDAINERANNHRLGMALAAVEPYADPTSWTNPFDSSRIQLFAPGRLEDGSSIMGELAGMRADLGLETTPINQHVNLDGRPLRSLSLTQRGDFIDKYVTPLETKGDSVRVADDLTTVSDTNSEEQNMRYGFSRLASDFVIDVTHDLEQPFIGKFNKSVGVLQDLLNKNARPLNQSEVVYEHNVNVELVSPDTARVYFQADVAEPIRFIENEFTIGN